MGVLLGLVAFAAATSCVGTRPARLPNAVSLPHHRPENALLVLVGPEAPDKVFQAAAEELGPWQRSAKRDPPVAPQKPLVANGRSGSRLIVGDRPSESQVTLEVGSVLPPPSPSSAAVEDVLVNLLGAKLDDDLRQRTGATYCVHVWIERLRGGTNVLHAESAIGNEQLAPSFKTFHRERRPGSHPAPARRLPQNVAVLGRRQPGPHPHGVARGAVNRVTALLGFLYTSSAPDE